MLTMLILTIVVLLCLWIVYDIVNGAPIGNAKIKWGIHAIAAIVAIAIILNIWGIAPALSYR